MAKTLQLKINLIDGDAEGRWNITIPGHSTWAYKIPKDMYKDCSDIAEKICRPSVYLLFGEAEDNYPVVYVGETEDALKRLDQHAGKKKYWSEAIVFGNTEWNSAYIKRLEGELFKLAKEAGRYDVKNDTIPGKVHISEDEEGTIYTYVEDIRLLAYALGHKVFISRQDNAMKDAQDKIQFFYFSMKEGRAKLMISEGKYVVCKDSYVKTTESQDFIESLHNLRNQLFADGTIKKNILHRDIEFNSPSYAAAFVSGNHRNGKKEWKTDAGVTLGEYMEG